MEFTETSNARVPAELRWERVHVSEERRSEGSGLQTRDRYLHRASQPRRGSRDHTLCVNASQSLQGLVDNRVVIYCNLKLQVSKTLLKLTAEHQVIHEHTVKSKGFSRRSRKVLSPVAIDTGKKR